MDIHVWTYRKLKRFEEMGMIWQDHNSRGATNVWIYENLIAPKFGVGLTTFYKALHIPCRRLLVEMATREVTVLRTDEHYNVLDAVSSSNLQLNTIE